MSDQPSKREEPPKRGIISRTLRAPTRLFHIDKSIAPAKDMAKFIHERGLDTLRGPDPATIRHESFEEAVIRQGLNDTRLQEVLQGLQIRAKIAIALGACDLLAIVWAAFTLDYMTLIAGGALFCAFASTAITSSFRCWQVKHRQLSSFNEWLSAEHPMDGLNGPIFRRS